MLFRNKRKKYKIESSDGFELKNAWCNEMFGYGKHFNRKGNWSFDLGNYEHPFGGQIPYTIWWFYNEEDAVAFKLRFS